MSGPTNLRVYGLLVRDNKVLIAEEKVAGKEILKFPGGGGGAGGTQAASHSDSGSPAGFGTHCPPWHT